MRGKNSGHKKHQALQSVKYFKVATNWFDKIIQKQKFYKKLLKFVLNDKDYIITNYLRDNFAVRDTFPVEWIKLKLKNKREKQYH